MKRSEINNALKELEAMCAEHCCYLPPFCHMTPDDWKNAGHEYDEIRDCMLGWDITDYGMGNFDKFGFSLITIESAKAVDACSSSVQSAEARLKSTFLCAAQSAPFITGPLKSLLQSP